MCSTVTYPYHAPVILSAIIIRGLFTSKLAWEGDRRQSIHVIITWCLPTCASCLVFIPFQTAYSSSLIPSLPIGHAERDIDRKVTSDRDREEEKGVTWFVTVMAHIEQHISYTRADTPWQDGFRLRYPTTSPDRGECIPSRKMVVYGSILIILYGYSV